MSAIIEELKAALVHCEVEMKLARDIQADDGLRGDSEGNHLPACQALTRGIKRANDALAATAMSVRPELVMRRGDEHHPGTVMKAAKRAAIEAGWLLETWATFAKRAYACLDPEASSEALSKFHAVVREYFDVV